MKIEFEDEFEDEDDTGGKPGRFLEGLDVQDSERAVGPGTGAEASSPPLSA